MSQRTLLGLVLAAAVVAGGCVSTAQDPVLLTTDPPWGLDTIAMPDDSDAIVAAMNAMHDEIDGVPKEGLHQDGDQFVDLTYGDGTGRSLVLRAISLAVWREGAGEPGLMGYDVLSRLVDSGEIGEVETNLDPSDETPDLVWMFGTSEVTHEDGSTETQHVASWVVLGGTWIFSTSADTPDARTALFHAFVEALAG